MFIINTGFLFSGLWLIVKPWIDPKTQAKIKIVSGSGKKELAKAIDVANLPVFLGGTCTKALHEDFGPWDEELRKSHERKSVYHSDRSLIRQYYWSEEEKQTEMFKSALLERQKEEELREQALKEKAAFKTV